MNKRNGQVSKLRVGGYRVSGSKKACMCSSRVIMRWSLLLRLIPSTPASRTLVPKLNSKI